MSVTSSVFVGAVTRNQARREATQQKEQLQDLDGNLPPAVSDPSPTPATSGATWDRDQCKLDTDPTLTGFWTWVGLPGSGAGDKCRKMDYYTEL